MAGSSSRLYWDACVFQSYIDGDEDRLVHIDEFLDQARRGEVEIVTSTLSIVEVAFASAEKADQARDPELEQAIDALWAAGGPVLLADFSPLVAYDARDLIRTAMVNGWSLKPADAIHLATARRVDAAAVHTYDDGWAKYSGVIGRPISEPIAVQMRLPNADV